jgi:hypothetical protein
VEQYIKGNSTEYKENKQSDYKPDPFSVDELMTY